MYLLWMGILVWSKTKWVFNTSMLIENKEYYLSVSCIEKNRWQSSSSFTQQIFYLIKA